jgi:fucose permease
MPPIRSKEPPFGLLCFGFVVCGIVTVLPGPLLPLLAARWGLPDVQSGAFFAAEFAASTIAAILAPRRMRWSLPRGYALMTVGVLLLVVAGRALSPAAGHDLALASFALIGLGVGLSVTATNLVVGGASQHARARRLSIVNLWWGIGAVACPWMIAATEHSGNLPVLLALLGFASCATFIGLLRLREEPRPPAVPLSLAGDIWALAFFALLLFLYVGVENTIGGWIATYANRFGSMTIEHASLIVSLFWLALLVGRWLGSLALKTVPERSVWIPGMGFALASVMMMTVQQPTLAIVACVVGAGMGFGPIFPIGVSRMLARIRDHRNTGWVFATCASGGAALPWITGLVSTRTGSLRIGFIVPVAALVAILLLALSENALLGDSGAPNPQA